MSGVRLMRFFRSHSQTFLVWAMMPLAIFNSRTIIGCGCTGHFEAVCHCRCCEVQVNESENASSSRCACCSGHTSHSCSCCHDSAADSAAATDSTTPADGGEGLNSHHCVKMAVHIVVPGISVVSHSTDGIFDAAMALMPMELPLLASSEHSHRIVQLDTGPPPVDCVIAFRRLVI